MYFTNVNHDMVALKFHDEYILIPIDNSFVKSLSKRFSHCCLEHDFD